MYSVFSSIISWASCFYSKNLDLAVVAIEVTELFVSSAAAEDKGKDSVVIYWKEAVLGKHGFYQCWVSAHQIVPQSRCCLVGSWWFKWSLRVTSTLKSHVCRNCPRQCWAMCCCLKIVVWSNGNTCFFPSISSPVTIFHMYSNCCSPWFLSLQYMHSLRGPWDYSLCFHHWLQDLASVRCKSV